MEIPFVKFQGTGNDFILVDEFHQELISEDEKPSFVKKAADRHFGIGSDGVIFAQPSRDHDAKFSFYNPDGSRAEMCGNGIRCFAKYLYEHGLVKKERMEIETIAGVIVPELRVEEGKVTEVRVNMGPPKVEFIDREVEIDNTPYKITSVNMGNPHAILFLDNIDGVDILKIGRKVRHYKELFPEGTNVHFIEKVENAFKIRTYERGVENETLACGTGISASGVAVFLNKLTDSREILFHAKGGNLKVELELKGEEISSVFLTGPAEEVFTGKIKV